MIERAAMEVLAERGYHGASVEEIARRSGVTPPVVYDHFDSKAELHCRLLERTRDELLELWSKHLDPESPPSEQVPTAIEAWALYVEEHPFAPRMYFAETTGIPEVREVHDRIQREARAMLAQILGVQPGGSTLAGGPDPEALEMAAEVMRAGLTGLGIWWLEHPHVPRARIVEVALNVVWVGLERAVAGDAYNG